MVVRERIMAKIDEALSRSRTSLSEAKLLFARAVEDVVPKSHGVGALMALDVLESAPKRLDSYTLLMAARALYYSSDESAEESGDG